MTQKKPSDKVISLTSRRLLRHKMDERKVKNGFEPKTRVMAVTSGKGGVGKTNIVANLGFAMCKIGKEVLVLDADLGLGNLDILLGLAPKYNFSHVITGTKTISEVTLNGPGNLKILPASSGIQELTQLTNQEKLQILSELDLFINPIDILLIDTAAGISSNVMYFSSIAPEIMVVVSPEPTSITDAYALMKVLSLKYAHTHFKLLVNLARNIREADEVFRQLSLVAERFLTISIEYVGYVLFDEKVTKSVKRQKLVCEQFPDSQGSKCFETLAHKICQSSSHHLVRPGTSFFWENFLQNNFE
jgi:flagellar biosynthesis protein FlhG